METGPARDAVLKTHPSAVAWQLGEGENVYRPDGLAVLASVIFGFGVGFLATGFYLPVGIGLALVGAGLLYTRFGPASQREPIFSGGRDTYIRLSSKRDLQRMGVSQGTALATGFGLGGVIVLIFVQGQPAWGVSCLISAATSFLFTVLVFRAIASRASA